MAMNSCGSVAQALIRQATPNSPGPNVAIAFDPTRSRRLPSSGMISAAGTRNDTMNHTDR